MGKMKITRPNVPVGAVTSGLGVQTRSMTQKLKGSFAGVTAPQRLSGMTTRSMSNNVKASGKRMKIYPGGSATFDETLGRKKK